MKLEVTGVHALITTNLALQLFKQFEIPLSADACCSKKVLDDEYGNGGIHRDHKRAPNARFHIDQVVAFLAIITKTVLLEYADEALVMHRPDGGHTLFNAHG